MNAVTVEVGSCDPGAVPVRVLCVDDNEDLANSEAQLLELVGLKALACYDGSSALVLAETFRPRVCLIDLNMPGMDGDELARRLREWASGRPLALIAITAMSNEGAVSRIKKAGFDLHLIKPVDPERLMAVVRTVREPCHASSGRSA